MSDAEKCLICGSIIPEGRQVCPRCERGGTAPFRTLSIPDDASEKAKRNAGKFLALMGDYISQEAGQWMADNGFFTAPASTCFHGAYEGGLFDHSFAVTDTLVKLTHDNHLSWRDERSPYIVGFFHDLCKIDQYRKLSEPDEKWRIYAWNDTPIKGHGEKSVMLLSQLMTLTEEETACIRYHMGAFADKSEWQSYTDAIHKFPNVLWTHHADMIAAHIKGT